MGDGEPELRERLASALRCCRRALADYQAGLLDDEALRRDLVEHGVVHHRGEIWLLDLNAGRWCRYDGFSVDPVPAPLDAVRVSRLRGAIDRLADELVVGP